MRDKCELYYFDITVRVIKDTDIVELRCWEPWSAHKTSYTDYSRRMEPEIKDAPTWMKAILTVIYSLLIISTIVGNYLVLRAFFKFSSLQSASNAILVSLSVVDFC